MTGGEQKKHHGGVVAVVTALAMGFGPFVGIGATAMLYGTRSGTCATSDAVGVVGQIDADQQDIAQTIEQVAAAREIGGHGVAIALAVGLAESGLRNLTYGDRDSLGVFQQRPSQGWGTAEQIMDPAYAAGRFFDALLGVRGWQTMPLPAAAQAVQRSAFADGSNYATHEAQADDLVRKAGLDPDDPTAPADNTQGDADQSEDAPALQQAAFTCPDGSAPIVAGADLAGAQVPDQVRAAIAYAMAQLGTMYLYGGSGPRFDCSGLTMAAYAAAGITIPRTSQTQATATEDVARDAMVPGDLIFWGDTPATSYHVAMYLGGGKMIEAPRTGLPVRITDVRWDGVSKVGRVATTPPTSP